MFENKEKCLEKMKYKADFFLRCFIIGFILLIITSLMHIFMFDWIASMANILYKIEADDFSEVYLIAMSTFKILIFVLFLIPYIAIKWSICKCSKKKK